MSSPADLTDAYVVLFQSPVALLNKPLLACANKTLAGASNEANTFTADDVVLSAGAWSAEMASWLDYRIPMAWSAVTICILSGRGAGFVPCDP